MFFLLYKEHGRGTDAPCAPITVMGVQLLTALHAALPARLHGGGGQSRTQRVVLVRSTNTFWFSEQLRTLPVLLVVLSNKYVVNNLQL